MPILGFLRGSKEQEQNVSPSSKKDVDPLDESFTERTAEVTDRAEEDELFKPSPSPPSTELFSWDTLRKESAVAAEDQRQYLRQQQRESIQKFLYEVQRERKECERLGITMKSRYYTRKISVKIVDKKEDKKTQ